MSRDAARRAVKRAVDLAAPGRVTEWCRDAGIDPKTLRSFLSAERWPSAKTLQGIERALGWPLGRIEDLAEAVDTSEQASVPDAIRADAALLPEVRDYLLSSYHLLLRLQAMPRSGPVATERERLDAELHAEIVAAAAERGRVGVQEG